MHSTASFKLSRKADDTSSLVSGSAIRPSHGGSRLGSDGASDTSSVVDKRFADALGATVTITDSALERPRNTGHRLYQTGCGMEKLKQEQLRAERERILTDEMAQFTQRPSITTRARNKPGKGIHFADHSFLWEQKRKERLLEKEREKTEAIQRSLRKTPEINVNSDQLLADYVNPVKGWESHFAKFCAKKSPPQPPNMFHPNINANAIRRDVEKPISERLFIDSYSRQEKLQEQAKTVHEHALYDPQTGRKLFSPQSLRNSSTHRDPSEVSSILHARSAEYHDRKKQLAVNLQDPELTHKPLLNKKSLELAAKVKRPIHEAKRRQVSDSGPQDNDEVSPSRKASAEDLRRFLARNAKTQRDRESNIEKLREQRESQEYNECTFHPRLNENSEKIFAANNVFGLPVTDTPLSNTPRSIPSPTPRIIATTSNYSPTTPPSTTRQTAAIASSEMGRERTNTGVPPVDRYISAFEEQMMAVLDEWKKLEDV